jgi:uncharacterized protein YdbL (DUF1318 family)
MGELEQPASAAASTSARGVAATINTNRDENFISVLLNPSVSDTAKNLSRQFVARARPSLYFTVCAFLPRQPKSPKP